MVCSTFSKMNDQMGLQLCPHSETPGVEATAAVITPKPAEIPTDNQNTHTNRQEQQEHQKSKPKGKNIQKLIAEMFNKKGIEPHPTRTVNLDLNPTVTRTKAQLTTPKPK